ncbi:MAG: ribonuclease R [Peptococcaceae bacterium]|nr:ribonuclease R [Peptococcaceae bacterium]
MFTKESIVSYIEQEAVRPLSEAELAEQLGAGTVEALVQLKGLLKELEDEGTLVLSRKNRYGTPAQFNLLTGTISRHPKGFGFLIAEDRSQEDLYIHSSDLGGALNGDKVIARIKRPAGFDTRTGTKFRAEGEVIRILQRHAQHVVGTFENSKHFGFVVPDDKKFGSDIFIAKDHFNGARNGMKVLVEIISWPQKTRSAEGKVTQLIGFKDSPGVDILSIIFGHNLPQSFPAEVLEAAERIPEKISGEEIAKRRDLRDMLMITIDGEDAKDLDDAVSVQRLENGNYLLGVHIADVGHYVQEDSALDKEALERATSIYLVDRVIPMLPQKLSNGVCSLNAGEDRLALTCMMEVDQKGIVVAHEIFESVIHIDFRMTYKNVTKILVEQDETLCAQYQVLLPMLKEMEALQGILERKRMRRGAIEFHAPESKVVLDKKGRPIRIEWRESGIADKIIEEFMLCANETVAEHYFWMEVPFLYRVHEEPKTEDVMDVNKFLQALGYSIKGAGNTIHPKAYQSIVDEVAGKPEEKIVNTVLLRSMQHARYDTEALGHFGLSAQYYSHFTSPIRRYPDLAIHRVIKELLHNGEQLDRKRVEVLSKKMAQYAEQSSQREKVAEEAERDSVDLKKVEFMKPYVGEIFSAKISGVTNFGLFVQLDNSVEGLVHISTLVDDFYQYRPESFSLLGEHTRKVYQLGQEIKVRLTRVSTEDRQIDFEAVK